MGKKVKKESETPCKETFEPLPVEGKTPATVVLLLSSPEEDILIKACEAIHTFAEKGDENRVSLLGLGALEPLCQLITHNNKLVKRNAFMALGIMATNGDVKNALKKLDVIPSIIDKLSLEEEVVVHEFATLCLASLSVDFVSKVQIFDNNGLPPLIQLLSSPDPDVKKNSLEIIFNLVQDHQSRLAVHELGGIPPLLELLNSDFPVIQHLVLKTLQSVTIDKDACNTFREAHGVEKLMDILNNTNFSDLHAEVLQVVANCVSDTESFQLIHNGGGLTKLMEFASTPNTPEIQSIVVKCIAKVAQSSENHKLLHELNVEKVLVELLTVADVSVKTTTCQAMSFHTASKDSYRDLGAIPAVVQLLHNESFVLREAATQALSSLTHGNQLNSFAVYEAGGHEILVQQLCESCPGMVANSAATLGNMAGQEVIRCSILSHGAIQALVQPLKSTNTHVLVNTTQCLAMLACDMEARAELKSAGGLQPLVNLLQSYHKDVLHNACLAINVCASDEVTTVEMCKFGALEMLQEINQSVNRRSNYSKLAMISLLNANLSVKYSLTGRLASTDIISAGFYDAGKAQAGQRILTLEELSKQPVNQHRPIIVVNTAVVNTEAKETVDVPEERLTNPSETDTSRDHRTPRRRKKDDKQKDETETRPQSPIEKPWKMMDDVSLQLLVKEAKEFILPLSDEREQYAALARLVSEAMGGAVEMEKLHEFPWVLHLSELKFQLQSNVIPIGLISRGIYCHRALLFKCLVDCIGMSCTLERGEYNRAWNEVLLFTENTSSHGRSSQPCRYIVDLMHQPGRLLTANTPAAEQYQTI
ncbi:Armadillo repeat-containing protein 3 Beta-catenin-like protein Cancer/testis antigen 81 [Larimichthys crocea]|uniref:Armadillo repeat-containing protein 3 Beta-catenin-like protein Cancer/testis antigen 81 n=1 Tax=Larimichthys crocea TaxID=215358 RepID=A0A6G0HL47_LARCR|nr:Armadillo repeat-containing protein 3 Beta-catenin-like protein Cancer/testis antigen 81 [Larimichthys crocea]